MDTSSAVSASSDEVVEAYVIRRTEIEREDVIQCVTLHYEKGSSGTSYIRKEKFRATIPRSAKSLRKVREIVRLVA